MKRLLRKKIRWFADASVVEEGDTPIKQYPSSRKRKHEQNSKEDDSADEFIDRKKLKIEVATKEKTIGKVHLL